MRISHGYQFVFLALPRTGSTTVRKMLDGYSDIKSIHMAETTASFPFYHHISASQLKEVFEDRGWPWKKYKKFCVVRNPYDRVVSLFHHQIRAKQFNKNIIHKVKNRFFPAHAFRDYVFQLNAKNRIPISLESFIFDGEGNCLVEDVLRFERLREDIPNYLGSLGLDIAAEDIPHLYASKNRGHYRKYYDADTQQRVRELYCYEIERFEYSF